VSDLERSRGFENSGMSGYLQIIGGVRIVVGMGRDLRVVAAGGSCGSQDRQGSAMPEKWRLRIKRCGNGRVSVH
jgi:hypothetical protein